MTAARPLDPTDTLHPQRRKKRWLLFRARIPHQTATTPLNSPATPQPSLQPPIPWPLLVFSSRCAHARCASALGCCSFPGAVSYAPGILGKTNAIESETPDAEGTQWAGHIRGGDGQITFRVRTFLQDRAETSLVHSLRRSCLTR